MLPPSEMEKYRAKARNPNLSYLTRKALRKQVHEKAKKATICPHCGEINGIVKKSGLLKICHEKYRNKKADPGIALKKGSGFHLSFFIRVANLVFMFNSRIERRGR